MDQQQLNIWFAGFYEGEGSVSNDSNNRNKLRLSISQNDPTPLLMAKEKWGGFIRKRKRITPKGKICHGNEWVLNHNEALKFIEDIKPYMLIPYKINQLNKVIKKSKEKWTKRFKCKFCDADFSDPSGRRRHEKNQHIKKGEKFFCEICNKQYNSIDSKKRHIRLNHNSTASVCKNKCDIPYNDGNSLRA
tara:strand:+ start:311 stop:880 length:570 start_codon:yes stop_codon:yes gene_type:complete